MRHKATRPKFPGRAALKTELKRLGVKVPRDFYGQGYGIAWIGSTMLRFRFDDNEVDVAEPFSTFDRWANSTMYRVTIQDLLTVMDRKQWLKNLSTLMAKTDQSASSC